MHRIYQQFIDSLSESHDISQLRECMRTTAAALELSCFAYFTIRSDTAPRLISTYPSKWIDHYLKHKYEQLDPVITGAASDTEPFQWGIDLQPRSLSVAQQKLFEEAASFGISCGFTVPIHDRYGAIAAVTFAAEERHAPIFIRRIERHREILQLLAMYFHAHVRKNFAFRRIGTVSLSPREVECLKWAAEGKSAWEIGRILGISKHTAATYLENAKTKLGVRTTVQAVARIAALRGIID
jgi:DNA-binding CsgD family transcriptional regulator